MINNPHIGNILKEFVAKNRTFKSAWARKMGKSNQAVNQYTQRPSINTDNLFEICQVLNYNFFADIAAMLPNLPHQNSNQPNTELEEIKKENERLKIENELLSKIVGLKQNNNK